MEQIVKGAGTEKSEPCRLGKFVGQNSRVAAPRRRPMKCGWHPQLAFYTIPNEVVGNLPTYRSPSVCGFFLFYISSFGNSLGATMVPSSLITDLANAMYALLTRFSGCLRIMGKPSSPDSATFGSIGISPRKGTLYS